VEAAKTVFNLTPVDNSLERRFSEFLDRATDVAAFAKLTLQSRFALEYISSTGALRYYYPDFVVRLVDDTCLVLETKGLEDVEVALKDLRARRWCRDASRLSGRTWSYYKVPQAAFEQFTGESVESLCRYLDAREGRPETPQDED
jgi:type III restriction enzyme